jgi:hypothetical protein
METKCTCERPDDNTCDYCEQQSSIEILEEAADRIYPISGPNSMWNSLQQDGFIEGAKWQAERMYSEEEVIQLVSDWNTFDFNQDSFSGKDDLTFKEWFEQFKKK